ncbi:MAG: M28 family peptidase [Candidatus Aminicenantes bacterium]|nr:M28 family peptidase [Candidatus Aminicenantes bacterium]
MQSKAISIPALIILVAVFSLCSGESKLGFDASSAYGFVKKQVEFGPRVPNTPAHAACADWLVKTLKQWTPDVVVQAFQAKAYDGRVLDGKNIVASFNAEAKDRILLCAHWDSRPFADHDPDPANHFRPVMGANDGASGVGVLLEVARQLSLRKPAAGVDILLLDLEDFGEHRNWRGAAKDSWALGSQYWARNPHRPGYRARFGILLDMVGASDAVFPMEGTSMSYAPAVMKKVWETARGLGLSKYFLAREADPLIDDHLYINTIAGIPTVDIIHYDTEKQGFPASWHTAGDTLDKIDVDTLKAVGQVVLAMIFQGI